MTTVVVYHPTSDVIETTTVVITVTKQAVVVSLFGSDVCFLQYCSWLGNMHVHVSNTV